MNKEMQERFDEKFPSWAVGQPNSGSRDAEITRIKDFLSSELESQKDGFIRELEGMKTNGYCAFHAS